MSYKSTKNNVHSNAWFQTVVCLEKNNFLLLAQLKTVFGKYYVQVFKKIILESPSVINMFLWFLFFLTFLGKVTWSIKCYQSEVESKTVFSEFSYEV